MSKTSVRHIAWLKFKPEVTAERIEEHFRACRALVGVVPRLEKLECGPNFTDRSGGFTHGIIVSIPDRDALMSYLAHPEHVKVANPLKEDLAGITVMDLEV